jgi:hypothetical protein
MTMAISDGPKRAMTLRDEIIAAARAALPPDAPLLSDVFVGYDQELHYSIIRLSMDTGRPPGNHLHCKLDFWGLDIFRATADQIRQAREDAVAAALDMAARIQRENRAADYAS